MQRGDESTGDDVLVPDMDIVRANVEVKFQ